MTDHDFDRPTLEQMGAAVRDGHPPALDPASRESLIETLRTARMVEKLREMMPGDGAEEEKRE